MRRLAVFLLFVVLAAPALALAQSLVSFPTGALDVVTAQARRHHFTIELAATPEQLSQGLMHRRAMPADGGMLFDFGRVKPVAMWMRNTLIPLDMVFIEADGRVAHIAERTVPMSEEIIAAPVPVRAVLELNGGTAARLGLKAGDKVLHPLFGG